MRILQNKIKVYGYDELTKEAKIKAVTYISERKTSGIYYKGIKKNYNFIVNDFEYYKNGQIMFYTNDINSYSLDKRRYCKKQKE